MRASIYTSLIFILYLTNSLYAASPTACSSVERTYAYNDCRHSSLPDTLATACIETFSHDAGVRLSTYTSSCFKEALNSSVVYHCRNLHSKSLDRWKCVESTPVSSVSSVRSKIDQNEDDSEPETIEGIISCKTIDEGEKVNAKFDLLRLSDGDYLKLVFPDLPIYKNAFSEETKIKTYSPILKWGWKWLPGVSEPRFLVIRSRIGLFASDISPLLENGREFECKSGFWDDEGNINY